MVANQNNIAVESGVIPTLTINNLTSTNGTITTLGSTTGTIGTLNSTTGTITTLGSTTGTITTLGTTTCNVGGALTVGTTATLTGQLITKAGLVGSPAIVCPVASDTGIYFPGTGNMAIALQGRPSHTFSQVSGDANYVMKDATNATRMTKQVLVTGLTDTISGVYTVNPTSFSMVNTNTDAVALSSTGLWSTYRSGFTGTPTTHAVQFKSDIGGTGTIVASVQVNGQMNSPVFNVTSDSRTKKDIVGVKRNLLQDIGNIPIKRFKRLYDDAPTELGVIAEDIETIFPSAVTEQDYGGEDAQGQKMPKVKSVNITMLLYASIGAIQKLSEKVAYLESKTGFALPAGPDDDESLLGEELLLKRVKIEKPILSSRKKGRFSKN
jgi:hypothetical protein